MTRTDFLDGAAKTELSTRRRRLRAFRFPVLVVVLLGAIAAFSAINQLVAPIPVLALPVGVGLAFACVAGYRRLSRTVELRAGVAELTPDGAWSGLRRGALLGTCLYVAVMALIAMFGGWQNVSWGSFGGLLATASAMAAVATIEEVLFRGVVFRILEERAGTVLALVVSATLFGLTHLINANSTLLGALAISLSGGALTTAAYIVTRSLWLPIGLHFAWNTVSAGFFGVAVSGSDIAPASLLHTTLSGPSLLTGGTFGPEASLFTLLVCLVPTVMLLRRAARTGQIRRLPRRIHTAV